VIMATVSISGLDRLQAKLRAMPREAKEEIRTALNRSADEVVNLARTLAPVADGDLRGSIRKESGSHDLKIDVKAGNEKAFYARWVEFGAPHRTATPFFFPAYRSLKKRIRSRLTRASTKAAKKVAKR